MSSQHTNDCVTLLHLNMIADSLKRFSSNRGSLPGHMWGVGGGPESNKGHGCIDRKSHSFGGGYESVRVCI